MGLYSKISKSDFTGATEMELSDTGKIESLNSQRDYWKLKYELLLKYGVRK